MKNLQWAVMFALCLALSMISVSFMSYHKGSRRAHLRKLKPPHRKTRAKLSELDEDLQEVFSDVKSRFTKNWKKLEHNYQELRIDLHRTCNGFDNAIMTQRNSPLGSWIAFDGNAKHALRVQDSLFQLFPKEHPFQNKTWDRCAVVGNGGILSDSKCGKKIDSADFVFRCNLAPLDEEFQEDVGTKTSLVTANPSILRNLYQSLDGRRRPFAERLLAYGEAMVLLPAFSYPSNTEVCLKAAHTIEDFSLPARAVFFNPKYLAKLGQFWFSKGIHSQRLSSGLMIVSLALELCSTVDVYGFWPYRIHPTELHPLLQHYYDDAPTKVRAHSMPQEFDRLLRFHSEGVLRLQLDPCYK